MVRLFWNMAGEGVLLNRVSVEVPHLHSASNSYEYTSITITVTLARRTESFLGKIKQCENLLVKRLLRM